MKHERKEINKLFRDHGFTRETDPSFYFTKPVDDDYKFIFQVYSREYNQRDTPLEWDEDCCASVFDVANLTYIADRYGTLRELTQDIPELETWAKRSIAEYLGKHEPPESGPVTCDDPHHSDYPW